MGTASLGCCSRALSTDDDGLSPAGGLVEEPAAADMFLRGMQSRDQQHLSEQQHRRRDGLWRGRSARSWIKGFITNNVCSPAERCFRERGLGGGGNGRLEETREPRAMMGKRVVDDADGECRKWFMRLAERSSWRKWVVVLAGGTRGSQGTWKSRLGTGRLGPRGKVRPLSACTWVRYGAVGLYY